MEKAFDKVWKDGLRLKLQKCGVTGCMYQWISQYLKNRKARVHKEFLKGSTQSYPVPCLHKRHHQGPPRNVQGAIYADDLVLWCTEEHLTTANYRLQEALNVLQDWTKRWLVKVNPKKTTYTIFSLSTREQKATLKFDGQILPLEDNPTYLGVTFDKRLTWKPQTKKVEARAKVRLAIMKKLAGTNWGADDRILKKLYTGRVRPVLEYGMTAWAQQQNPTLRRSARFRTKQPDSSLEP
ncbi:hypothetical protein C0Q70_05425 [Pomacea canaliculata]|uniref:Reverse transcriptase domain-containing protein n=1 Tax=Pomacea canaliculata TaxID=400727 RepID=A0A2T7PL89_POMCA|nr:hypothetical protein C0Q70_05425 [Pomacea canaliculata]